MMRYMIHRVGPGHAMGFGCVVGVILGFLPVAMLIAAVLLAQAGQAEILRALGPLGSVLAPRLDISWNVVGLASLMAVVASGLFYAVGGWLAALGFNLVAHMTGGLALDIAPDGAVYPIAPAGATPYVAPVQKDPTMPLPRPLQGAVPPAPFPAASSSGVPAATAPPAAPSSPTPLSSAAPSQAAGGAGPAAQPVLVSETDATILWTLRQAITTIGSDPANDVVLTGDAQVAPRHAEIRAEASGYIFYDLGAPGGTYVNGRQVQGRNRLKDGFRIRLGGTALLFRDLT